MKAHHLALSSLITLSFFLAILPPSYCTDDARFVDCSHPYECGRIINVSYPFWGVNRPEYCGRQGFKLECYDDEYPIIKFEELEFLILNINESQNNMTIARLDLWHGFCPQTYLDTVLNYNIFDYAPTVLNITLFYDCPLAVSTLIPVQNKFKCSLEVHALNESLNQGFEVDYDALHVACRWCVESGENCGSNVTYQFVSFCRNGERSYNCPGNNMYSLFSS
ncbi:leaf rust 10 disease-resistance locus receptor-like protein kinase-like 1.4 [Quercus suber]|uniref:non-specific serine/threonine protein kinase n=1 Tax=Quercus suber TaxID=58331 RepID=A0AAW0LAN0_QUESU